MELFGWFRPLGAKVLILRLVIFWAPLKVATPGRHRLCMMQTRQQARWESVGKGVMVRMWIIG